MTRLVLGREEAEVRKAVVQKMDRITENLICKRDTALRDLLELARTQLLVICLPETLRWLGEDDEPKEPHGHRITRLNKVDTGIERDQNYLGLSNDPAISRADSPRL